MLSPFGARPLSPCSFTAGDLPSPLALMSTLVSDLEPLLSLSWCGLGFGSTDQVSVVPLGLGVSGVSSWSAPAVRAWLWDTGGCCVRGCVCAVSVSAGTSAPGGPASWALCVALPQLRAQASRVAGARRTSTRDLGKGGCLLSGEDPGGSQTGAEDQVCWKDPFEGRVASTDVGSGPGRLREVRSCRQSRWTAADDTRRGMVSRTSGGELTGPSDGILQETRRDS